MLIALVLAALSGVGIARASAGAIEQNGIFALLGARPAIVSKLWAEHGSGLSATLKIRQFRFNGAPVLDYEIDMQRLMHLVVVRDDFATFDHLHPTFDATTGTFAQVFTKAQNHRYYVYADTTPRGVGQQVYRFTIESDGAVAGVASLASPSPTSTAGPYTLSLTRATLAANRAQNLSLTVFEGGKPARGLRTYLGAAAHAVFINTATLTYVHVHPTVATASNAMTGMTMAATAPVDPFMRLRLPALPTGTYKLWVQFRGANDVVYTAPFTILVRYRATNA